MNSRLAILLAAAGTLAWLIWLIGLLATTA